MKAIFSSAIAASVIAISLSGCGSNSSSVAGDTSSDDIKDFEVHQTVKSLERNYICEGTEKYYDDSTKVYSTVKIAIEWPEKMGDHELKTLKDSLISAIFDTTGISINQAMLASAANPEGADLFKVKPVDSIPSAEPVMLYTRNKIASVITFSPDFIVYQVMTTTYDGGAHGITESRFLNYDFEKNEVLNFDNTFEPDSSEILLQAIKDNLMTQYNVSSLKGLDELGIFSDQIYVTKNFYLQGYNVVFHYNPYDIAAYSKGSIDVRVPFYQISGCLKDDVISLLTENDF